MIPVSKPHIDFTEVQYALRYAWQKDICERLEETIAKLVGVEYAVTFPYARTGIYALLRSPGLKGREVITPAYTGIAVPYAIAASGNLPVFVDIELPTYNMRLTKSSLKITKRTKAVIVAHLYGHTIDVQGARELVGDRLIIEDAAMCLLSNSKATKVGLHGDAAVFSLASQKQLWATSGGIVTTNDDHIYRGLIDFRQRSMTRRLSHTLDVLFRFTGCYATAFSFNYAFHKSLQPFAKTTETLDRLELPGDFADNFCGVQAAICFAQLSKIQNIKERRQKLASLYSSELKGCEGIELPPIRRDECLSHYTIRVNKRDQFYKRLVSKGIRPGRLFNYSLPHTSTFSHANVADRYTNAKKAADSILNLPLYPSLSEDEVKTIYHSVAETSNELGK